MLGADIRWAPFEGFRTGAGGILPDISIGGGVRTVMGTAKFTLTTVGIDVELSKPIPIADSVMSLTPYVGFQRLVGLRRLDRHRRDAQHRAPSISAATPAPIR